VTITQYWPPVTSWYTSAYYYRLPAITQGQTVNFTLIHEGASLFYYVRDPANNVILTGTIASDTMSGSDSFTATTSGVYSIECVPSEGYVTVFSLSFSVS
jgi:hypothetical protein